MHKVSQKTWLTHLAEDKRYFAMAGLGFSSGLPFLLVYSTQSAWLSEAGVPIETIGLLSELTIAYKSKFVWSPFLDKYDRRCSPPSSGAGAAGLLFRRSQLCWR
jgi:PAT family beta-lactamase induction signal transducer AmpG